MNRPLTSGVDVCHPVATPKYQYAALIPIMGTIFPTGLRYGVLLQTQRFDVQLTSIVNVADFLALCRSPTCAKPVINCNSFPLRLSLQHT